MKYKRKEKEKKKGKKIHTQYNTTKNFFIVTDNQFETKTRVLTNYIEYPSQIVA